MLLVSGRLGLTSIGGPIAHLSYFHAEYVRRRRWLDEETYAGLVALCQSLPGPTSSQVGIAVGLLRAGLPGAFLAWLGFTLPSAVALIAFAYGLDTLGDVESAGWLRGLKIAAVAVVALAVWSMARTLTPDRPRAGLAIAAAVVMLVWQTAAAQVVLILGGAALGYALVRGLPAAGTALSQPFGIRLAAAAWLLFFVLLFGLPLLSGILDSQALALFDAFYRAGSLVFGGGHVVLPLLQAEVVPPGWLSQEDFLAGYGAAQAVPGPLFTFAAYLGAAAEPEPNDAPGGALALAAIFLPSFLLIVGGLPVWSALRGSPAFHAALRGINAAVVGILLAALYDPVATSAIGSGRDLSLALVAFGLLALWRAPPLAVVLFAAAGGEVLAAV